MSDGLAEIASSYERLTSDWAKWAIETLMATIRDRDKKIVELRDNLTVCSLNYFALQEQNTIMREALERIEKANYTFCNASDIAREARAQVQANPREQTEARPSTD